MSTNANKPFEEPCISEATRREISTDILGSVSRKLGYRIKTVPMAEANEADCLICVLAHQVEPRFRADNLYTLCDECGEFITHRPHATAKKKICVGCAKRLFPDLNL